LKREGGSDDVREHNDAAPGENVTSPRSRVVALAHLGPDEELRARLHRLSAFEVGPVLERE
jgi:hypothetical protein